MPHQVQGVIARAKGEPVSIETIVVPDPGPGEALVAVQACGVCHTDLHYREGGINDEFPFLLGHEAAGIVESVGAGVTDVAPGDFVILNWRAVCGNCRACRRGRPRYCFATHNATQKMTLLDGTALAPRWASAPSPRRPWWPPGQCTKVDPAAPPEVAGLLGVRRDGRPRRRHEHRANVGRGDSGGRDRLRRRGRRRHRRRPPRRRAHDHRRRRRRPEARVGAPEFGATHTVNSSNADPVAAIRELTGGFGADVVIDAVGLPEHLRAGVLRPRPRRDGRAGRGAQPRHAHRAAPHRLFGRGGALKSSWYGDCLPSRDFPMLIDLYLQGRLDLDGFVSETIGARRRGGGVPQDGARRGAAQRGGAVMTAHRPGGHRRHLQPRRRGLRGREQHLARGRRPRSGRDRRRPRRRPDPRRRSAGARCAPSCARTPTTTTSTPRPSWPRPPDAPIWLHPDDTMLWEAVVPRPQPSTPHSPTARASSSTRPSSPCCTPRATRPVAICLHRRPGTAVQRRHPVPRRPRRHRALVQRAPDHPSTASAASCSALPADTRVLTGHGEQHHDRGRGRAPRPGGERGDLPR